MTDNAIVLAAAPIVVGTVQDSAGVQHEKVVPEYVSGTNTLNKVSPSSPLPIDNETQVRLQSAILIEMAIANELQYALVATEVEPLETLRAKYRDLLPVLLG